MQSNANILFSVKALSNLVKRRVNSALSKGDDQSITGTQGFVIAYLCNHSDVDIFQRDIEAECRIRRSTATGILQLMEKNGLILREPVAHDARLKKITVTDKAVGMRENFLGEMDRLESAAQQGLSQTEIAAFLATLHKIKKNLE